jgi:uncharacterized repeat protein (TIGR01451 family)
MKRLLIACLLSIITLMLVIQQVPAQQRYYDLLISKSGPVDVEPNGYITYTLSVANDDWWDPIKDLVVTDTLPLSTTFVSASNGGVLEGQTVYWRDLADLSSGDSIELKLTVQAPDVENTPNKSITVVNRHYGVKGIMEGYYEDDYEVETIGDEPVMTKVINKPNLISSIQLDPPIFQMNRPVTITVNITNTGSITTGRFFVDFYINPTEPVDSAIYWNDLGSTLSPAQGLEWFIPIISPGQVLTLTSNGAGGGLMPLPEYSNWQGHFITNTTHLYSYADSYSAGNTEGLVGMESSKSDNGYHADFSKLVEIVASGSKTAYVGGLITYSLTISNNWQLDLSDLVITDRVSSEVTFYKATQGGMLQDDIVSWRLPALMAQSITSVQFSVIVNEITDTDIITNNPNPRIIGGIEAEPGAWPWQVALVDADEDSFSGQYCGGTLIRPEWVLTAGHCVVDYYDEIIEVDDLDIVLGRHDLTSDEGQRIKVAEIIIHPDYYSDYGTADFDLALIRLEKEAELNDYVQPIDIADPNDESLFAPGVMATVTGWGARASYYDYDFPDYPDTLHQVSVPIITNEVCNEAYEGEVTSNMMCAGYAEGGKDSCYGDSGGPLVVPKVNGRGYLQVGIVSWGQYECAAPDYYGVYTRAPLFKDWIEEYAGTLDKTITNRDYQITTTDGFITAGKMLVKTTILTDYKAIIVPITGGTFIMDDNRVITIPENSFESDVTLLYKNLVTTAPPASLVGVNVSFILTSTTEISPSQPYTMSIGYNPDDVEESALALYYLDENGNWIREPTSQVDLVNHQCIATPNHFGVWAIFGGRYKIFIPAVIREETHQE